MTISLTWLSRLGLSLLFATAIVLGTIGPSQAAEVRTGDQPGTSGAERVADDLYMAGGNVVSSGTIVGDLVVAGGNVTVNGTVSTDLLVVGGSVIVLGNVQDDVRAAGGNITINGTVDGDVIAGGGNVQLAGKRIGGDVLVGGGSVRLDTPVAKDVRIVGEQVTINAPIAGNVEIDAEALTLGSGAVISGTLTYRSPNAAVMEKGASVKGKVTYTPIEINVEKAKAGAAGVVAALGIISLLTLLVCSLVIGLSLRRWSEALVAAVRQRPLTELGRGFALLVTWPVACIMLLMTVVGIPFGIVGLLGYIIVLIFSHFTAPILLGSVLYAWVAKGTLQVTWKTILLGAVVYAILAWIPVVGWVVRFVFFLFALGAMMRIKWDTAKDWR